MEYVQWGSFSTNSVNPVHVCEIEADAVCTEVSASVEGLEEEIQAVVESAGEHIVSAIECLSSN